MPLVTTSLFFYTHACSLAHYQRQVKNSSNNRCVLSHFFFACAFIDESSKNLNIYELVQISKKVKDLRNTTRFCYMYVFLMLYTNKCIKSSSMHRSYCSPKCRYIFSMNLMCQ